MALHQNKHKIGLLVISTDTTVEVDFYRNLPAATTLHSARMLMPEVTIAAQEEMLANELSRAAGELASLGPDLVLFAGTSASGLHGPSGERDLARAIQEKAGCPAVTAFGSVVRGLRSINPNRLLLLTPYLDDLTQRVRNSLVESGIRVEATYGMSLKSDLDIGAVSGQTILKVLREKVDENRPDCVFISCTNLHAWQVLPGAVKEFSIPVLSTNFLMFWQALEVLGYPPPDLLNPAYH